MDFSGKCLLCSHYTNENVIAACKIWSYSNTKGIPDTLCGCDKFQLKQANVYYLVRIPGDFKHYRFNSQDLLDAFILLKQSEGLQKDSIEIEMIQEF